VPAPAVLSGIGSGLRRGYRRLEEKPWVVLAVAATATSVVAYYLAAEAGTRHLLHVMNERHAWSWLLVCLVGEVLAYGGYVLTIRDMSRVDDGEGLELRASLTAVVGGFGVFAATRTSGGFAVDYWAFREAGASKREAVRRVLALTFLEYVVLSVAALIASALLFFRLDGHASDAATLPALTVIPIFALAVFLTSPARVERLSTRKGGWFRRTFADSVAGAANVRNLLLSPREHGLGVLGNALYWAGDIACLWAALQFVNVHLTISALVLAYSGGYVLTRRALPAGGAGFVEAALTFAIVAFDVHFAPALAGVMVYRLFNFWLPIVPALLMLPAIRDLRDRFEAARRA
jgi:uncharacterized membrane protein YbhN (UPF0104 family)